MLAPYVMAFLATVAALFIRSALNPFLGNYVPYVTLFPARSLLRLVLRCRALDSCA